MELSSCNCGVLKITIFTSLLLLNLSFVLSQTCICSPFPVIAKTNVTYCKFKFFLHLKVWKWKTNECTVVVNVPIKTCILEMGNGDAKLGDIWDYSGTYMGQIGPAAPSVSWGYLAYLWLYGNTIFKTLAEKESLSVETKKFYRCSLWQLFLEFRD